MLKDGVADKETKALFGVRPKKAKVIDFSVYRQVQETTRHDLHPLPRQPDLPAVQQ